MAARGFPFIKLELDEKHAKSFLYSIPSGPDLSSAIVLRLSEHSALDYNIINEKIGSQLGSLADRVVQRPDVEFREPIQCEVERRRSQRHTAGLEPITPPHYTEKVDGQPWNNVFGDRDAALSRVWAEEVISQQVLSTVIKQEDRQLSFNSISTSPTKRKLQKTERRANRSDPTDINTSPRKQSPSKGHITKDSRGIVFKRSPSVYGKALRLETKDRTLSITLEKEKNPVRRRNTITSHTSKRSVDSYVPDYVNASPRTLLNLNSESRPEAGRDDSSENVEDIASKLDATLWDAIASSYCS